MSGPTTHPAIEAHIKHRESRLAHRTADTITRFAGSMSFVFVHVVWFGAWIIFRVEPFPYGLLTMIVSLEAIFLSTVLLISQNRADERRQMLANAEWVLVKQGEKQNALEVEQNTELLEMSRQILELTREIRTLQQAQR